MKILIIDGVGIKGVSHKRGEVVEVDDRDGRLLIQMGKAKLFEDGQAMETEFPLNAAALVSETPQPQADDPSPDKPHRKWRKGN